MAYTEANSKEFMVGRYSCVSIVMLAAWVVVLLIPLLVAHATNGLWTNQVTQSEQADVDFTGSLIIAILDDQGNEGIYSTVKEINDMEQSWQGAIPTTKMMTAKDGEESMMSDMRLELDLLGMDPSTIRNIKVLASFDYALKERLNIELMGLMNVNIDTPNGASQTFVVGELVFQQKKPVSVDNMAQVILNIDPISWIEYMSKGLAEIVAEYNQKEERVEFKYTELVQPYGFDEKSKIQIDIVIPKHMPVNYKPGLLEGLKGGWIQYLNLLLPCLWIFKKIRGCIFKTGLIETTQTSSLDSLKVYCHEKM